jgi:hypothetical protein
VSDTTNNSIELVHDETVNPENGTWLNGFNDQSLLENMLMDVEYDDIAVWPHNEFCFFGSAFRLPEEIGMAQINCFEDQINLSASVILFNMGLVCHTRGLLTGHSRSLRRGMEFYQMVVALIGLIEDIMLKMKSTKYGGEMFLTTFFFESSRCIPISVVYIAILATS